MHVLGWIALVLAIIVYVKADDSYYPCDSYISFGYDDSNALSPEDFRTQMNFIVYAISQLNYPYRLRINGVYSEVASWNSTYSITQMKILLNGAYQYSGPFSLRQTFVSLLADMQGLPPLAPLGAIIFIADTSDRALQGADQFAPQIKNGNLTFVLMGPNVDQTKLWKYASSFLYWSDMSKPQPDYWDYIMPSVYGCPIKYPTYPPTTGIQTTTVNTIPPEQTSAPSKPSRGPTTKRPTTPWNPFQTTLLQTSPLIYTTQQATQTPTPTGTPSPFYPCRSYISFSYDDSNSLYYRDFKLQMDFIANAIGAISSPYRIRVKGAYTDGVDWFGNMNITSMQDTLYVTPQKPVRYSLLYQFVNLYSSIKYLQQSNTWPLAALIFISDTSNEAIANADILMSQLAGVKLTFVLMGPNADQGQLQWFSNSFITWRDLTQPKPDNWDSASWAAYGCSS